MGSQIFFFLKFINHLIQPNLNKAIFFLKVFLCEHLHSFSSGGVILYAGSSGSASPSPGSPSSGYQTQSPSSHSQPSSPEEVTFTEIGALKQRAAGCNTPSSKLVFQFPEVYSGPSTPAATPQHSYAHPIAGKRPCGFPGTFTSKFS